EQQLLPHARARAWQLDRRLSGLDLDDDLVDLDLVARLHVPLEDLRLGETLPHVRQLELLDVSHAGQPLLSTPGRGRRRRVPGRGQGGTPPPPATADTACAARRPAGPATRASRSTSRSPGRPPRRPDRRTPRPRGRRPTG